jgi:hypothetical protein
LTQRHPEFQVSVPFFGFLHDCGSREEHKKVLLTLTSRQFVPLPETMIAPSVKANSSHIRKKTVHFPRNLTTVIEINTVTEDEKSLVWYQSADYVEVFKDIEATVLELIQLEEDMRFWDTTKYSLRGIEHRFSPRYRDQRRKTQRATVAMVLRAQKEYGHVGPEAERRIQRVSRMCSKASRERAIEVGALDQEAAGIVSPIPHHDMTFAEATFHESSSDHSLSASLIAQEA